MHMPAADTVHNLTELQGCGGAVPNAQMSAKQIGTTCAQVCSSQRANEQSQSVYLDARFPAMIKIQWFDQGRSLFIS